MDESQPDTPRRNGKKPPLHYPVSLTPTQRQHLEERVKLGRDRRWLLKRYRILLLADVSHESGGKTDTEIIKILGLSCTRRTIIRLRVRYHLHGLDAVRKREVTPSGPRRERKSPGSDRKRGASGAKKVRRDYLRACPHCARPLKFELRVRSGEPPTPTSTEPAPSPVESASASAIEATAEPTPSAAPDQQAAS